MTPKMSLFTRDLPITVLWGRRFVIDGSWMRSKITFFSGKGLAQFAAGQGFKGSFLKFEVEEKTIR